MPSDVSAAVLPGETIGDKYRVERVLGSGAMGTVVAARHLHLDERVAIKLMRGELSKDADVVSRFMREAKAAAKVKSDHVVRVFDVGALPDGAPYIVMEHLEGADLSELLAAEGPLPPKRAVDFVLQACDALSAAHAVGIVHRDLKPANLFLARHGDGAGRIKVLDFGISKVLGAHGTMTQTSALMGSPLYMSPEQLMSARDVDARSDLWSLGVVLFELLTGAHPFNAESVPQLCVQIRETVAPPVRSLRQDVPPELERIVARCLERDPARRFSSVRELASALVPLGSSASMTSSPSFSQSGAATLAGASPSAASASEGGRATNMGWRQGAEPPRRSGSWIALIAAVALAALIGIVLVVAVRMRRPSAPAAAAATTSVEPPTAASSVSAAHPPASVSPAVSVASAEPASPAISVALTPPAAPVASSTKAPRLGTKKTPAAPPTQAPVAATASATPVAPALPDDRK